MKKIGVLLLLLLLAVPPDAFAWVGGPYSNNTYDGFSGGIFTGTIRGPACSGIFKFSQGGNEEAYVSPFGDSIVYFKGMAYYGECYGFVDTQRREVSGVTNGSNWGNESDPNTSPEFRYNTGTYGVYNGTGAYGGDTDDYRSRNMAIANSEWDGQLTSVKPGMRFKAKGTMTFFGNGGRFTGVEGGFDDVFSTVTIRQSGEFTEPDDPAEPPVLIEGTVETINQFGSDFPNVTDTIRIHVNGTRTSVLPFILPTNYAF